VVLVPAAAAGEGTAGAAGAEVAERTPRRCFLAGTAGQHALGPFRVVELSFDIIIRCFELQNLLFIVFIATD
jgi:hypothetical protein